MFHNLNWVLVAGCLIGYLMSESTIVALSFIIVPIVLYCLFFVREMLIYQAAVVYFLISMWFTALFVKWQPAQILIASIKNFLFQ